MPIEWCDAVEWADDAAGPIVRPYAMVRGRTHVRQGLFDLVTFIVAMVSTLDGWLEMGPEHQAIVSLCDRPRTVSEVAGLLNLPLGVVRVLLGDLYEAGAIRARSPDPASRASVSLLLEVLNGLRAL
jgi:hypothetical protein